MCFNLPDLCARQGGQMGANMRENKRKRNVTIGGAAAVITILLLFSLFMKNRGLDDYSVVGYVNGQKVTYGEFNMFFPRYRAITASQMYARYGMTDSAEFWNTLLPDGSTPLEIAKQSTMEELKRMKASQILFKEYHILEDISYQTFRQNWKAENLRRLKALEEGKVIFGPDRYEQAQYYIYLQDSYSNMLQAKLADSGETASLLEERIKDSVMVLNQEVYNKIQLP